MEQTMNKQQFPPEYRFNGLSYRDVTHKTTGNGASSRVNINIGKYCCTPVRKNYPNIKKITTSCSQRHFLDVKALYFRKKEISEIQIGQVRLSERTADAPIKNSWCVSFVNNATKHRYVFMYVDGKKIAGILPFSERVVREGSSVI